MRILGIHSEHDSSVCLIEDRELRWFAEAEKDSGIRHARWTDRTLQKHLRTVRQRPDVVAIGGWWKKYGGYYGVSRGALLPARTRLKDRLVPTFSSSHERGHILCAYGLSPFPQGQPCYALVWEGTVGAFYSVSEELVIRRIATVLPHPGHRYSLLFEIADARFGAGSRGLSFSSAGKLMALAAFGKGGMASATERRIIARLLSRLRGMPCKRDFSDSRYFNMGVDDEGFRTLARRFSDALFDHFYDAAVRSLRYKWPLLISGGCGLNCDWNSRWKNSSRFADVFVPPCTNDTGAAIGAAIDAQFHFSGNAKIAWSVYAGEEFVYDELPADFSMRALDNDDLARRLLKGGIFAWVSGRYEVGPRALGHRSILATPFTVSSTRRLNRIKVREDYRPIAAVCRQEDAGKWFSGGPHASPHMLYLFRVRHRRLRGVTHADGTTRLQTVSRTQDAPLWDLLTAFGNASSTGVLCNTSLNFPGKGFINRMSHLTQFVRQRSLDGMVVNGMLYLPR